MISVSLHTPQQRGNSYTRLESAQSLRDNRMWELFSSLAVYTEKITFPVRSSEKFGISICDFESLREFMEGAATTSAIQKSTQPDIVGSSLLSQQLFEWARQWRALASDCAPCGRWAIDPTQSQLQHAYRFSNAVVEDLTSQPKTSGLIQRITFTLMSRHLGSFRYIKESLEEAIRNKMQIDFHNATLPTVA